MVKRKGLEDSGEWPFGCAQGKRVARRKRVYSDPLSIERERKSRHAGCNARHEEKDVTRVSCPVKRKSLCAGCNARHKIEGGAEF